MQPNKWRAISLFAGAGGCSLGFSAAGVEIISAYEKDESAIKTYNKNFAGSRCHNVDLATCNFEELRDDLGLKRGELDLIIGGPPCQGFTTVGNRFWADPRNKLIQNYAKAIESFYPRWFMMENVEGMLTTAKGMYVVECIQKMIELGYSVYLRKVYMQEYGVPQRRKRVILVGNKDGKSFEFPQVEKLASGAIYRSGAITLRDAIGDLENRDIPAIDHIRKKENGIQLERIIHLSTGQSMKDLPEYLQHSSFRRRASRRVCDGTPTEKRGGAPAGIKRLSYEEPCLTITSAATSEFIHPIENRMLTIRECARIQTFPDTFIFEGTDAQKMQQIGNAIPPRFAKQIAEQIFQSDRNQKFQVSPSLVDYEVTKASAKSPALARTCKMLDEFLNKSNEQLTLEVALCH